MSKLTVDVACVCVFVFPVGDCSIHSSYSQCWGRLHDLPYWPRLC